MGDLSFQGLIFLYFKKLKKIIIGKNFSGFYIWKLPTLEKNKRTSIYF